MIWESYHEEVGIGKWPIRMDHKDFGFVEGLSILGEAGWELVSTELATDKIGYYLFFKREILDNE